MNTNPFKGRIVVITGGTKGIGKSICQRVTSLGATCIVTSRNAQEALEKIDDDPLSFSMKLDVAEQSSVNRFFQTIQESFKRLDVLVNNAGIGYFKSIEDLTLEEWRSTLETNLTGAFICIQHALNMMKKQKQGRIINIGTIVDATPLKDNSAYACSKIGLRTLSNIVNEENHSYNIRSSVIRLGAVYTDIWKSRKGFDPNDMISLDTVADAVEMILKSPMNTRIDEITLAPSKGIL